MCVLVMSSVNEGGCGCGIDGYIDLVVHLLEIGFSNHIPNRVQTE